MKKYLTAYKLNKTYLKFVNHIYLSNKEVFLKKYFKKIMSLSSKQLWLVGQISNRNVSNGTVPIYNDEVLNYLKSFVNIYISDLTSVNNEIQYKNQFEIDKRFYYYARSKQDGSYIGFLDEALNKINNGVTQFFKAKPDHSVASIGFDPVNKEWHGWSHRAWSKFKIGHVVKEGSCESTSGYIDEYLIEHPEENIALPVGFIAKTIDDVKRCAISFADSVG